MSRARLWGIGPSQPGCCDLVSVVGVTRSPEGDLARPDLHGPGSSI